jgi:hypothetical protein
LDRIAEQCGVSLRVFADHCNASMQTRAPSLTPDFDALAAAVLRDLEHKTAEVRAGRGNGAEPEVEPKQEAEAESLEALIAEAKILKEGDSDDARRRDDNADDDEQAAPQETGNTGNGAGADDGGGAEPELESLGREFKDLITAASALQKGDNDGARRLINEGAQMDFDPLAVSELLDAIQASTKAKRPALNGSWKRAVKQAEQEAERRAGEEAWATLERQQAEEAALREQLEQRVASVANDPEVLSRVVASVHRLGVVREDTAIRAVYLTIVSRLLRRRVISTLRRGTAASGKNHLIEQVLALFPPGSVIRISGSSAKVLPYSGGDDPDALAHKAVYFPEAAAVLARREGGQEHEMAPMVRTMIAENILVYQTVVVRDGGQTPVAVTITKNGPIVVLATSARDDLEDEMITRFGLADSDESSTQSSLVMTYAFDAAGGLLDPTAAEEAEVELLRDFQRWLENGLPYDVLVPFAPYIRAAFVKTPRAVRIRRDINTLVAGVGASAVLHKAQREIDAKGRIIATLDDYGHAWDAFGPGVAIFHNPQQSPGVIALVRVLEQLIEEERKIFEAAKSIRSYPVYGHDVFDRAAEATYARLTDALGLASRDTISARITAAKVAGVIECVNETFPRSVPRRYRVRISSTDLAAAGGATPVFPPRAEVERMMRDQTAYAAAVEKIKTEEKDGQAPSKDPHEIEF